MNQPTTTTLDVRGMHCANCGLLIDETLEDLPGVFRAQTDTRRARTTVTFDPTVASLDGIVGAITELGYRALDRAAT